MTHHDLPDTPAWLQAARPQFAGQRPDADRDAAMLARLTRLQQSTVAHRRADEAQEPRWLRRLAWGSGALGATAAMLMSALLLLDPPGRGEDSRAAAPIGSGFIALVPEGELRAALATGQGAAVWLQPTELPRERLALLGLPFDAARAEEFVRAELMLNPSGQVLAVRILN